jgi:methionyl aminopeptidase
VITLKSKTALTKMAHAGAELSQILRDVEKLLKPGTHTLSIDQWITDEIKRRGLVSLMRGYKGYQHVSCISVNDVIVHGVPNAKTILKEGDLVKLDVCASYNGYAADLARPYFVGKADPKAERMVDCAKRALDAGIKASVVGNRVSDISVAIQEVVEKDGFGIVRIFAGHGIGKRMHEDPEILNYGKPGRGPLLQAGMTFALEPMITMGSEEVSIDNDKWTARTQDGLWAAHVEDTVAVTASGPQILTRI